jgi:phospholipid-binding lipoprotein MlaA
MNNTMHTLPETRHANIGLALIAILMLAGCASQTANLTNPEDDPWEASNRKVYGFNTAVDKAILKPIAKGYDVIMPDAPQRGVRNFFRNLQWPITFVNLLLQGRVEDSLVSTGRFLLNSTLGLAGFFDPATRSGIEEFDEDFGQTLAVWGWKDSRYLMVPFIGPATIRDLSSEGVASYSVGSFLSPTTYMIREHNNYVPLIIDLISLRASLLPYDKDIEAAADPYAFVRDAFLQNREFEIYNGDPPAPDYDALLEED